MVGHYVTCTVWKVIVSHKQLGGDGGEQPLHQRQCFLTTAADDGAELFEVARTRFFPDAEQASKHEFSLLVAERLFRAEGLALGKLTPVLQGVA